MRGAARLPIRLNTAGAAQQIGKRYAVEIVERELVVTGPDVQSRAFARSRTRGRAAGQIGKLRADFDRDGSGFFSSWEDIREHLKTDDRIVQQAIAQVLVPLYEPQFIDGSYGYRPDRSAQMAIQKVKEYAEEGYKYAVLLDLSKYFDTLNHALNNCV